VRALAARLAGSPRITVVTGAGVSAASGIPTFRGAGGLWKSHRPEELATPEAFDRDPLLVWEWYAWRRERIAPLAPNAAHAAIAELEGHVAEFLLATQNVDGLHTQAGSRRLVELHGSLWRVRCTGCRRVTEDRRVPFPELPPACDCGALLRPDVVWFGEPLPYDLLKRSIRAVEACDVMLVVGTSSLVQPAASMAGEALARGTPVVEINLDPTPLSERATYVLQGKAGEILPRLL